MHGARGPNSTQGTPYPKPDELSTAEDATPSTRAKKTRPTPLDTESLLASTPERPLQAERNSPGVSDGLPAPTPTSRTAERSAASLPGSAPRLENEAQVSEDMLELSSTTPRSVIERVSHMVADNVSQSVAAIPALPPQTGDLVFSSSILKDGVGDFGQLLNAVKSTRTSNPDHKMAVSVFCFEDQLPQLRAIAAESGLPLKECTRLTMPDSADTVNIRYGYKEGEKAADTTAVRATPDASAFTSDIRDTVQAADLVVQFPINYPPLTQAAPKQLQLEEYNIGITAPYNKQTPFLEKKNFGTGFASTSMGVFFNEMPARKDGSPEGIDGLSPSSQPVKDMILNGNSIDDWRAKTSFSVAYMKKPEGGAATENTYLQNLAMLQLKLMGPGKTDCVVFGKKDAITPKFEKRLTDAGVGTLQINEGEPKTLNDHGVRFHLVDKSVPQQDFQRLCNESLAQSGVVGAGGDGSLSDALSLKQPNEGAGFVAMSPRYGYQKSNWNMMAGIAKNKLGNERLADYLRLSAELGQLGDGDLAKMAEFQKDPSVQDGWKDLLSLLKTENNLSTAMPTLISDMLASNRGLAIGETAPPGMSVRTPQAKEDGAVKNMFSQFLEGGHLARAKKLLPLFSDSREKNTERLLDKALETKQADLALELALSLPARDKDAAVLRLAETFGSEHLPTSLELLSLISDKDAPSSFFGKFTPEEISSALPGISNSAVRQLSAVQYANALAQKGDWSRIGPLLKDVSNDRVTAFFRNHQGALSKAYGSQTAETKASLEAALKQIISMTSTRRKYFNGEPVNW